MKVLSIVAPLYNEAEMLVPFYSRLRQTLEKMNLPYEIIYVNDGSTDQSLALLLEQQRRDPGVKVLDLSRNFGKEAALTAGLDAAEGEAVIPIDVDLQDPPEIIPELVEKWREGYDVVYAVRRKREGESYFKRLTASLFYRIIRKITNIDIPFNAGDFRLMSRSVVCALKGIRERHRFMKGLFAWVGFKQTAVTYDRAPRLNGKTKWNYWKLWNFALEGITSFSHVPLQLASYLGFAVALFSFSYGAFMIVRTLIRGNPVPGYPSIIVFIVALGGVQLITLGIIGEYIVRIYNESKERPLYIVKSQHGFEAGKQEAESSSRNGREKAVPV